MTRHGRTERQTETRGVRARRRARIDDRDGVRATPIRVVVSQPSTRDGRTSCMTHT